MIYCNRFCWHFIIRLYICRTISGFPASSKLKMRGENVWNFERFKTVKFHFCFDILKITNKSVFRGKSTISHQIHVKAPTHLFPSPTQARDLASISLTADFLTGFNALFWPKVEWWNRGYLDNSTGQKVTDKNRTIVGHFSP